MIPDFYYMGLNYYQIKKQILKARKLVIKATAAAGSGHPGGSFSMAEILGCLFEIRSKKSRLGRS